MDERDPRAVLGLSLNATRAEAQRAFRLLAKQTHPDAGGNAADFRAVVGAWAELAPRLPAQRRMAPPSPHVRAYRGMTSRVVWAETRPRPSASTTSPDFAAVLRAEMARVAA